MNIDAVLKEYDAMFGERKPGEILDYLEQRLVEAQKEGDTGAQVMLLNEIIGFCRDASFVEEGVGYAGVLSDLIERIYDRDRREYGTTMLNLGNAYRGYGMPEASAECYDTCEQCFDRILPGDDFLYAGLFNNRGLLYQETGEWEKAIGEFRRALKIAEYHREKEIERATTCANLATSMLNASPEYREEAKILLEEASAVFEKHGGDDFHYSAALSALGTLCYEEGDYGNAAEDFRRAMEILYAGTGESEAYLRVKSNYELAANKAGITPVLPDRRRENAKVQNAVPAVKNASTDTARRYYEEALLPALEREFPAALEIIAIGYAGEGSEHFGYDDSISLDHDHVRGCTIWVQELHAPLCAEVLQQIFVRTYKEYFKEEPDLKMGRQGVRLIEDYFEHLTGIGEITMLLASGGLKGQLYLLGEEQSDGIATAVNGELFHDGEGTMTKLRRFFLEEMPEDYRRRRIATLTHVYSQAGQYDYARCLRRGDTATAQMYKARAMEAALKITSLLNRRFPPYLKWLRRFVSDLPILPEISDLCTALGDMVPEPERFKQGGADDAALTFDIIARILLDEMKRQGLIDDWQGDFMDDYIGEIAGMLTKEDREQLSENGTGEDGEQKDPGAKDGDAMDETDAEERRKDAVTERAADKNALIEKIVAEEWAQFDKTVNEGGRADCQDNWETFSVMRRSQYLTWDEELLASFYGDLTKARQEGRNLITEKYGRMMESTAPQKYAELAPYFVKHDEERIRIQEEIIRIQVGWMEEFAKKYPQLAGQARSIHTFEDNEYNTSYETYLRGEIGTYSDETLILYGRFIASLATEGKNLAYETMNNTARLLGYRDAEDAERKMEKAG